MNSSPERTGIQGLTHWLTVVATALGFCFVFPPGARTQEGPKVEVGGDYNYVRTNAPPGGCGCFSMNGGDVWVAYNFTKSFAGVTQVSVQHASSIGGIGADLTLTSYLFGPRYSLRLSNRIVPFGQMLLGGAHATGSLAPGNPAINGRPSVIALTAGGGVDIGLTRRFAIRAAEVDYYMMSFNNGSNDQQNSLRISAGVVVRF